MFLIRFFNDRVKRLTIFDVKLVQGAAMFLVLAIAKLFPEIMEVHHVAGEDCYLLKVRLKDNKALAAFMREKIGGISEVTSTRTVIVLETIKESSKIKLPDPVNNKSETKP